MYIILARIKSDGKIRRVFTETEGYRIFDSNTNKCEIVNQNNVKNSLKKGVTIKGLKLNENGSISKENGTFSLSKIPFIDGFGNYIEAKSVRNKTVYGYKGFAEAKKFYLVDYTGKIYVTPVSEFYKMVERNEVNGAKIIDGKIAIADGLYSELA